MRIVTLDKSSESMFWEFVNRDPLDYFFFIYDLKQNADRTKVFLALDNENIAGLMLVYADTVVQLRGSREAVKSLLESLSLASVEMQVPLDCEDLAVANFKPRVKETMVMMRLARGEERIQISTVPVRLGVEDVDEITDLMRVADPSWWGEVRAERLKSRMADVVWLGIKQEGKIVSVGSTRFYDVASNIHVVATKQEYRNMGYATSIVSALVKEILKVSPIALIHVLKDNSPAVRAYSKVGFKPYKTYLSIRT